MFISHGGIFAFSYHAYISSVSFCHLLLFCTSISRFFCQWFTHMSGIATKIIKYKFLRVNISWKNTDEKLKKSFHETKVSSKIKGKSLVDFENVYKQWSAVVIKQTIVRYRIELKPQQKNEKRIIYRIWTRYFVIVHRYWITHTDSYLILYFLHLCSCIG